MFGGGGFLESAGVPGVTVATDWPCPRGGKEIRPPPPAGVTVATSPRVKHAVFLEEYGMFHVFSF